VISVLAGKGSGPSGEREGYVDFGAETEIPLIASRVDAALAAARRQRAVIVRHFPTPRITDYLRITVGTDAQIERLLSALPDIPGSEPAAA
jgi:histidinol-phosphate/aromatic aminotransferase/cobyric acid decarboxylase-like protein